MRKKQPAISCATRAEPYKDAPQPCVARWLIAQQSPFSSSRGDSSTQTLSGTSRGANQWPF